MQFRPDYTDYATEKHHGMHYDRCVIRRSHIVVKFRLTL